MSLPWTPRFPRTEHRRAKHWSRPLGIRLKIFHHVSPLAALHQHGQDLERAWGKEVMMEWWSLDQTDGWLRLKTSNPTGRRMTFHLPSAAKQGCFHRHPSVYPASDQIWFPYMQTDQPPSPSPRYRRAAILPPPSRIQNQQKKLGPTAMQRPHTPSKLCCTSLPIRRLCRLFPARLPVQGPSQKGTQCPVRNRPDGSDGIKPPSHAVACRGFSQAVALGGQQGQTWTQSQETETAHRGQTPAMSKKTSVRPSPTLAERTSGAVVRRGSVPAPPPARVESQAEDGMALHVGMQWMGYGDGRVHLTCVR